MMSRSVVRPVASAPSYAVRGAELAAGEMVGPDRQRYFIVTHGRSGSSLLAAILESCGADFGPGCAGDSDTERDHWESRRIDRAIRCAHRANRHFTPAMCGMGKAAYRYWRSRAKVLLRVELREARYSKNRWNTVVLPLAEHLGYRPVIIVSYRQPAEVVLSDMRQLKNMPSTFMASITQTYLDALYALGRYGGVVVDHAELVDPAREDWAFALEAVTGLEAGHLLAARRRLLKPVHARLEDQSAWLPSDLRTVAQCLASRRNLAVMPEEAQRRPAR
jgi:hypothetical protein